MAPSQSIKETFLYGKGKGNFPFLACEIFKLKKDVAPELIQELIPNRQRSYGLRNNPDFAVPMVKSVHKGLENVSYFGPKIWELLPLDIIEAKTLSQFKAKVKNCQTLSLPSLQNMRIDEQ